MWIDTEHSKKICEVNHDSNLIFYMHGKPVLEICEDGAFKVNGETVTSDVQVYKGFCQWLQQALISSNSENR